MTNNSSQVLLLSLEPLSGYYSHQPVCLPWLYFLVHSHQLVFHPLNSPDPPFLDLSRSVLVNRFSSLLSSVALTALSAANEIQYSSCFVFVPARAVLYHRLCSRHKFQLIQNAFCSVLSVIRGNFYILSAWLGSDGSAGSSFRQS